MEEKQNTTFIWSQIEKDFICKPDPDHILQVFINFSQYTAKVLCRGNTVFCQRFIDAEKAKVQLESEFQKHFSKKNKFCK